LADQENSPKSEKRNIDAAPSYTTCKAVKHRNTGPTGMFTARRSSSVTARSMSKYDNNRVSLTDIEVKWDIWNVM